jgi:Raf kinase inhibitor-like YbhB/YbcL family protein
MRLESPAFRNRARIPTAYTCDGDDVSPPLEWFDPPQGVRSFVLRRDDPDAPSGTWHHWAAYNIPGAVRSMPAGAAAQAKMIGFEQGINHFERATYGGPCPARGHGTHHYRFRLLALPAAELNVEHGCSCADIEREARIRSIEEAVLIGVYGR